MVNLKINVIKPQQVDRNQNKSCLFAPLQEKVELENENDALIHEQILHVPESEKLKVIISTDTEIDKIDVFVKNKKDSFMSFNSHLDKAFPNVQQTTKKPNIFPTPENYFEDNEDELQDVESLSDDDLRWWLKNCSVDVGPITGSTRKIYQSKLATLLKERKSLRLNSGNFPKLNQSPKIDDLTTREIHTVSKLRNIQRGLSDEVPKQEIEAGKKGGIVRNTMVYLLSAFVALLKFTLFALSGMVAYYLVFDSD